MPDAYGCLCRSIIYFNLINLKAHSYCCYINIVLFIWLWVMQVIVCATDNKARFRLTNLPSHLHSFKNYRKACFSLICNFSGGNYGKSVNGWIWEVVCIERKANWNLLFDAVEQRIFFYRSTNILNFWCTLLHNVNPSNSCHNFLPSNYKYNSNEFLDILKATEMWREIGNMSTY